MLIFITKMTSLLTKFKKCDTLHTTLKIIVLMTWSVVSYAIPLSDLSDKDTTFVVASKKDGVIVIKYSDGRVVSSPALFGKAKKDIVDYDDYNSNPENVKYVTPSSTFLLEKGFSTHIHESILSFVRGDQLVLAIHPVWLGNIGQNRVERLKSQTAADNRITNGCINVFPDFFYNYLYKLPNNTKIVILKEDDILEY